MKNSSLNHAYRLVWSDTAQCYQPVPETARGRGKSKGRSTRGTIAAAVAASLVAAAGSAWAGPTGGTVSAGSGNIRKDGNTTTITQNSQNLAINWATFSIGASETVNFVQPGTSAIALNRVTGNESSVINGALNANGQVWLLNANGVLFGKTASVNVGGLVASTLALSDADFMNGNARFTADGSQGSVINQGSLTGGYVALLGKQVSNSGSISTTGGTSALAAGDAVTLSFTGNKLLSVQVDAGTYKALAENSGLIQADDGTVLLSATAKDALLDTVVNNTGVIQARGISTDGGRIVLLGGFNGGTLTVDGTLDASSRTHDGGFIETSGAHVQIADNAHITTLSATGKTGTWLVDPTDFTIASGSGARTSSGIGASTLNNLLASNNVTLETAASGSDSGDINVNAAVNWSANTTLTLTAANNIYINAPVTATGASAGLALNHGGAYNIAAPVTLSGASASLSLNGQAYTLVHSMSQLDGLDGGSGFYALAKDLDAAGTTYGDAVVSGSFTGTFAGLGHTVSNLTISAGSTDSVGLFSTNGGVIRDLGLVGGSVTGNNQVGALLGYNTSSGLLSNVFASSVVQGGLVDIGGLVGFNDYGTISRAYASGNVSGANSVGGLVGFNRGALTDVYATGSVSATSNNAGGLLGYLNDNGSVVRAYATGTVHAAGSNAGGLVGYGGNGSINQAYATSPVSAGNSAGGLIGYLQSSSVNSIYWDSSSTGQSNAYGNGTSAGAVTSSSAYNHASYSTLGTWTETASDSGVWVAANSGVKQWVMIEGSTRPFLYSEYSTSIGNAHQLQLMAANLGASYTLSRNIDASETVGSNTSGMWTPLGFSPIGKDPTVFSGSLDGSNHTVTGLTIHRIDSSNSNYVYTGLVGRSTGSVSNIGLLGGSIAGGWAVGALVGWNEGSISNAYATGNVSGVLDYVGGLVGINNTSGSIRNAHASGSVSATGSSSKSVGGLAGYNDGSISDAYATGSVTGSNGLVGGLVGQSDTGGSISNAYATGSVTGSSDLVGGLVGENLGLVSNSYARGNVSASASTVGGLIGHNTGNISTVYATGTVSGRSDVGGLIGYHETGTVSNAYATGNVSATGDWDAGGLIGQTSGGSISNSYATGNVSNTGDETGGLVGYNWGANISNSYATGTVTGHDRTGGLVGYSGAAISNSYATGAVSGNDKSGGLAGQNDGNITNTYASGNVTATSNAGGLVGWNYQVLDRSYATGSVTGSSSIGGLVGTNSNIDGNDGRISKSFFATTAANGTAINSGLNTAGTNTNTIDGVSLGKTWAQLSTLATFTGVGWSVAATGGSSSVWRIYAGSTTPLLRSFLQSVTLTADASNGSKTYDGTAATGTRTYTSSSLGSALDSSKVLGSLGYTSSSKNAGTYSVTGGTLTLAGLYSGQQGYDIGYANTSLTISKANLTVSSMTAGSRAYDGTTAATLAGGSLSGLVAGETLVLTGGSGVFDNKDAGSGKAVTVSGLSLANGTGLASNYSLTNPTGLTGNITPKALTIVGMSAVDKVYNGSATATLSGGSISGLVNSETLGVTGLSASFADTNVGTGKTVSATGATLVNGVNGGLAANYTISNPSGLSANITPKPLTVSGMSAGSRAYDGSTAATLAGGSLNGLISGETLVLTGGNGVFADKNVGNSKAVTVSGLSLADGTGLASNYSVANPTGLTGDITPAALIISGITASNKTYDATTTATLAGTAAVNGFTGDAVFVSGTGIGIFADKNAGAGKDVTVSGYTLSGSDAGNYNLAQPTGLTATINRASLAVTGTIAASKTYDGSTSASLSGGSLNGLMPADAVTLSQSGSFADKNAGPGKTVNYTNTLSGNDADNYVFASGNTSGSTNATITAKAITAAITAAGKTYDGLTSASTSGTLAGVVSDDTVALTTVGSFADKNTGNGKTVNVSGSLSGADAGNYTLSGNATTTATITAKGITAAITAADKTYDGLTSASTFSTLSGAISGDTVALATVGSFADKNAGSGKTVDVSGSLTGADAGNYTLSSNSTTTATITARGITAAITANSKTYDGLTIASTSGTLSGAISGDNVALATVGSFADKNAGTAKTVNVSGSISGSDAGNYTLSSNATTNATIAAKALSAAIVAESKTYDGTTTAAISGALSGAISGDTVTLLTAGSFADKNAGRDKTVTVSGSLSGADAGNYTLSGNATTTATITAKAITATITAAGKTYDGGTAAVITGSLSGVVSDDNVALATVGSFADRNAGSGKTVNVTGSLGGSDAGNYSLSSNATTMATIHPAALTVTANNDNRTASGIAYSGGNGVNYAGLVAGETSAVLGGSISYGGSSQGAIAVGDYTIAANGLSSGNYRISYVDGTLTIANDSLVGIQQQASQQVTSLQSNGASSNSSSGAMSPSSAAEAKSVDVGSGLPASVIRQTDGGLQLSNGSRLLRVVSGGLAAPVSVSVITDTPGN